MKRCFYESSVPYITHNVLEVLLILLFGMLYHCKEEEEEEEEEEPLLIYTAQGSPFRCKKLSVINGSPERNNVLKL